MKLQIERSKGTAMKEIVLIAVEASCMSLPGKL